MKTETTVIALSPEEYKRELAEQTMLYRLALDWIGFFENDFENDEDQTYTRMETYIESVEVLERHFGFRLNPYTERMVMRVKERMSEVKI